ncbi:MAG TPA: response regulator [candidate division Zixibacteria bacterium]|nr:response regulator [candidate division Zixibacteria bacterium]
MPGSAEQKRILWVDDEIDSLKSHILFLEKRGYAVEGAVSGDDAVELVRRKSFDLVLLDEMMPGKDGLTTLEEIKEIRPHLPVVMVTKSEEETLMDQAIGQKIDDYLTKPVNPTQILSVIKRMLEAKRIISSSTMQRYVTEMNRFNQKLFGRLEPEDWYEAGRVLAAWNLELDRHADVGLEQALEGSRKEWNTEFTKYLDRNYLDWLHSDRAPTLSPRLAERFLFPHLREKRKLVFIVVDCMRLDQWLMVEPLIAEYYDVRRDYYFSILPSATPFARNALFAGLFPDEIAQARPDLYRTQAEGSLNRLEDELFEDNLQRHGFDQARQMKYVKIYNNTEGDQVVRRLADFYDAPVATFVFNFLDILAHGRSNNVILKEIAGSEAAFRTLMQTWFIHSPLFAMLKLFAGRRDTTVIVTTDHGSVLCRRGTMAHGKRTTSTNLRYKYGDNLNSDPNDSILVKKPKDWRLPLPTLATTYILAREDFFFVYPNNYNEMIRQFQNSFQHGGVSLEEMVVPVATLNPR